MMLAFLVVVVLCINISSSAVYYPYIHTYVYTYILFFYRQQQLQFRPPLEEIRAKYYREMKKFVCIPHHFRGVGDSAKPMATIFPRMIDRNPTGFLTVYRKVIRTFYNSWIMVFWYMYKYNFYIHYLCWSLCFIRQKNYSGDYKWLKAGSRTGWYWGQLIWIHW